MHQVAPFRHVNIYVFLFLVLISAVVSSSEQAKSVSSELIWLPAAQLPMSAVNIALAESNIGAVSGLSAIMFNPAGLTRLEQRELQANRATPQMDTVIESVSVAVPTVYANIGISLQQLSANGLVTRDEAGNPTGFFQYTEGMLALTVARTCSSIHLGTSIGRLWQSTGVQRDDGVLATVGMQLQKAAWRGGATAAWGGKLGQEQYPLRWRVGVSYERGAFTFHWAKSKSISMGIEWQPVSEMVFRVAAAQTGLQWIPAVGLGIKGNCVQIDYAYNGTNPAVIPEQLPLGHVLSVRFRF